MCKFYLCICKNKCFYDTINPSLILKVKIGYDMDNKEKLTYLVLKTFCDNIPHNKYFIFEFIVMWIMFVSISCVVIMITPPIISLLLAVIYIPISTSLLFEYNEIKNELIYNRAINDKYIDKIKHQFSSKNNTHLKNIFDHTDYPEDVQVIIHNIMKDLTSKEDVVTYHDMVQLYKKYEEKAYKYEQVDMMKRYVRL